MLYKVTEIVEAWDFEKNCAVHWDENSYCMNEQDLIQHAEYCYNNSDVEEEIDLTIFENAIKFLEGVYRIEKAPDKVNLLVESTEGFDYLKEYKGVRFEDIGFGVIEIVSGGQLKKFKVDLNSGRIL